MFDPLRCLVSRKKHRCRGGGFNLDLSYITDQIIAMGFPSVGLESCYRNRRDDVISFLDTNHPGQYMVINLCAEKKYAESEFDCSVVEIPFYDHSVPTIADMYIFALTCYEWTNQNPHNVVAVHCKAGKGRTGLMISVYLWFREMIDSTDPVTGEPIKIDHEYALQIIEEKLSLFGEKRSSNCSGVTVPSQRAWARIFASIFARILSRIFADYLLQNKTYYPHPAEFKVYPFRLHSVQVPAQVVENIFVRCRTGKQLSLERFNDVWVPSKDDLLKEDFCVNVKVKGYRKYLVAWFTALEPGIINQKIKSLNRTADEIDPKKAKKHFGPELHISVSISNGLIE